MQSALPSTPPQTSKNAPPKRRRAKRSRRGRSQVIAPNVSGTIRVRDTEKITLSDTTLKAAQFPFSACPRLGKFSAMYGKYMIHSVLIRANGLIGSSVVGIVHYGVAVDGTDALIKDGATIDNLRPSRVHHASKSSQFRLTHEIQLSKWTDSDSHAFTLYMLATVKDSVTFDIVYDVSFSSPRPF